MAAFPFKTERIPSPPDARNAVFLCIAEENRKVRKTDTMCDGDCETCNKQCPFSKLAEKLSADQKNTADNKTTEIKPTEQETMSQSTLSCHSSEPEKIVSQGERINAISAGGKCCIGCLSITAVIMIGACIYLNGKIGDVQLKHAEELTKVKTEYSIRIDALEKAVAELKAERNELKSYAEDGRRAYDNARQTVSRARKSQ